MIIDSITLRDFRVFNGTHTIKLTPQSKEKPVILFGALNGSGKTSLLDALKLVLYGKNAQCSKRGRKSFASFIKECINDKVTPSKGTSIELEFRTYIDGKEEHYKVNRSWNFKKDKFYDNFKVWVNGKEDALLEGSWHEFVDSFIPAKLSHLFFFDGEKIEEFADLEYAKDLLGKAMHSLLGIDTVAQLEKDLIILQKRKQKQNQKQSQKEDLLKAENEFSKSKKLLEEATEEHNVAFTKLISLQEKYKQLRRKLKSSGGELFEHREEFQYIINKAQEQLKDLEKEAESIAAGVAPFLLIPELVDSLAKQAEEEDSFRIFGQVDDIISTIDKSVVEKMSDVLDKEQMNKLVNAFKTSVGEIKERVDNITPVLELQSASSFAAIDSLPNILQEAQERVNDFLALANKVLIEIEDYQRKIANIPAEEIIKPLIKECNKVERDKILQEGVVANIEEKLKKTEYEFQVCAGRISKLLEEGMDIHLAKHEDLRIIEYTKIINDRLVLFRNEMIKKYVGKIEQYIYESFSHLLHKSSLVYSIKISPEDYSISLEGKNGEFIHPDKLSAGERQLLAVSMLWGLAKAAERPLPAVIDTPLGRLDSSHRTNLVEKYFPSASHQVILLSTDEEIHGDYHSKLKPFISRSYTIEYDNENQSSVVSGGYQF